MSQVTVSNFAALWTAKHAGFTGAEWGEVVGQHPTTEFGLRTREVDPLRIHFHTQCSSHEGLGFSTCEERRTVSLGGHADARVDETNLIGGATINATTLRNHLVPHDLAHQLVPCFLGIIGLRFNDVFIRLAFKQRFNHCIACSLELLFALMLSGNGHGFNKAGFSVGINEGHHVSVQFGCWRNFCLLNTGNRTKLIDGSDDLLDFAVSVVHGVHHGVFGHLVGTTFHHAHGIGRTGNHQVHLGNFHLSAAWVYNQLTVDR